MNAKVGLVVETRCGGAQLRRRSTKGTRLGEAYQVGSTRGVWLREVSEG